MSVKNWIALRWGLLLDSAAIPTTQLLGLALLTLAQLSDAQGRVAYLPGTPDRGVVFVVGLVVSGVALIVTPLRNYKNSLAASRLRELREELARTQQVVVELTRLELAGLFSQLGYATNERISLFAPSKDRSHLRLVARWAIADRYRSFGRTAYPLDQGCVGRAWQEEEAVVDDLPDPESDYDGWSARLWTEFRVPLAVSANFRMRSRTCMALAINPPGSRLKPCQGVLVVESQVVPTEATYTPYLELRKLRQFLKKAEMAKLARLLEILNDLED